MDSIIQGLQFLQDQFVNNEFFFAIIIGGLLLGLVHSSRSAVTSSIRWVVDRLFTSVTIHSSDESYVYVQKWLESNRFDLIKKHYRLITQDQNLGNLTDRWGDPEFEKAMTPIQRIKSKRLVMAPFYNTYILRYNKRWMLVKCYMDDAQHNSKEGVSVREYINIRYLGYNKHVLTSLFEEVRDLQVNGISNKILVKNNDSAYSLISRTVSSNLVLRADVENAITNKIDAFIASRDRYERIGIPYHTGMLLYGPPGTGKTSTIRYLAGIYDRPIVTINLTSLRYQKLSTFMADNVPEGAIVAFEEVDCLFDKRTSDDDDDDDKKTTLTKPSDSGVPTFAEFVNVIDGIDSPEDVIYIFTTNHIEKIDDAFIRPGRVDLKLEIKRCDRNQLVRMWNKIQGDNGYAEAFADHFADEEISPAAAQNMMMTFIDNPKELLNQLETNRQFIIDTYS